MFAYSFLQTSLADIFGQEGAFSDFESRPTNYEAEYIDEEETSSIGHPIGEGRGKTRITHSRDSNKNADDYEMEEKLQDWEDEKIIEGTESAPNNDHWKAFVNSVDVESVPNLDAYIKTKAVRNETSTRLVNAMDDLIQSLRDSTEEILSELVGPICNSCSENFSHTEEDIIETMVSNHSRRKEFLEIVHSADVAWAFKCNELTAEIMGEVSGLNKMSSKHLFNMAMTQNTSYPVFLSNSIYRVSQTKKVSQTEIFEKIETRKAQM